MDEPTSLLDKIAEAAKPRPIPPPNGDNGDDGDKKPDFYPESPAAKAFKKTEDLTVYDWLRGSFSGGPPIRISLHRTYPQKWNGQNIEGLIATYDEFIDEDFVM